MQARQTTGEAGGNGASGVAGMAQAGTEMDMGMDAGGENGGLSTMEQTFTYALSPALKFDITVTVRPVPPPTAGMIGGGGTRPKDTDD